MVVFNFAFVCFLSSGSKQVAGQGELVKPYRNSDVTRTHKKYSLAAASDWLSPKASSHLIGWELELYSTVHR